MLTTQCESMAGTVTVCPAGLPALTEPITQHAEGKTLCYQKVNYAIVFFFFCCSHAGQYMQSAACDEALL